MGILFYSDAGKYLGSEQRPCKPKAAIIGWYSFKVIITSSAIITLKEY